MIHRIKTRFFYGLGLSHDNWHSQPFTPTKNDTRIEGYFMADVILSLSHQRTLAGSYTRCTWAGGTCMCELPWFFWESSVSCYLLCYSRICTFFKEFLIHNSRRRYMIWRITDRICWACAIFRWIPNLQVCTDGRTDRQTDELSGLGWVTYRFLQVSPSLL